MKRIVLMLATAFLLFPIGALAQSDCFVFCVEQKYGGQKDNFFFVEIDMRDHTAVIRGFDALLPSVLFQFVEFRTYYFNGKPWIYILEHPHKIPRGKSVSNMLELVEGITGKYLRIDDRGIFYRDCNNDIIGASFSVPSKSEDLHKEEFNKLLKACSNDSPSSSTSSNVELCPDGNHPHAIDLGLPSGTKWACCNVGASAPEDYGGHYAWGETETKNTYNQDTYRYYNAGTDTYSYLGSNIAGTKYDVAHMKWGGSWTMPTEEQFRELFDKCTTSWTGMGDDTSGRKFTGPNGNSIFLPNAGQYRNTGFYIGTCGYYWTSTKPNWEPIYAKPCHVDKYDNPLSALEFRYEGNSVRPVCQ